MASVLGRRCTAEPAPGAHGATHTWLVQAADARWYCRWGLPPRKLGQERRVATDVWPRLPGAPVMVALDTSQGALLMTACPGTPGVCTSDAVGAVGRLTRLLHELTCESDDPLPLADALVRRAVAAEREIGAQYGPQLRVARRALDRGVGAIQGPRRWCHRDLSPSNWTWDGARASLVDWEHARPDAPTLDLAMMATTPHWTAFSSGYGSVDPMALRAAVALQGMATVAWAIRHGDVAFLRRGLTSIETL